MQSYNKLLLGVFYVISILFLLISAVNDSWDWSRIIGIASLLLVGMVPQLYKFKGIRCCGLFDLVSVSHIIVGDISLFSLGYGNGLFPEDQMLQVAGISMIFATGVSHAAFAKWDNETMSVQVQKVINVTLLGSLVYVSASMLARDYQNIQAWLVTVVQLLAVNVHNKEMKTL